MAVLYTTHPGTLKYLTWIAQTMAYAYGIAGVPPELVRGDSVWLQERMASVVCSIVGHDKPDVDFSWSLEITERITAKVILYCAEIVSGRLKVDL